MWWKIYIDNPDRNEVPNIVQYIRRNVEWVFVYSYHDVQTNSTHIRRLIVFTEPHSGKWMTYNIYRYGRY
jgi:hypothetical protein